MIHLQVTKVNYCITNFHKREKISLQHNKLIKCECVCKTHKKVMCQTEEAGREMTEWWGEEVDGCSLDRDHTHTHPDDGKLHQRKQTFRRKQK
jgi:hypothetical protein